MRKRPLTAAIRVCNFGLGILWEEEVQIFSREVSRINGVRADCVRLNSESVNKYLGGTVNFPVIVWVSYPGFMFGLWTLAGHNNFNK